MKTSETDKEKNKLIVNPIIMKVKDVMTGGRLKSCTPETKLENAAKIMKENNRGALPVVDKDQKVVGIITDRDICLSVATKKGKAAGELTVKEVLPKAKIRTIKAEDKVKEALKEMRKNKVGRLPVTDKTGKLQGMVSINNILSRTIKKNKAIGQLKSKNENLAKTMKALFDRNSSKANKTKKDELEIGPGAV
jgi:IMP dehydrogenase